MDGRDSEALAVRMHASDKPIIRAGVEFDGSLSRMGLGACDIVEVWLLGGNIC